ncbi:DUF1772 domain-containing protein [Myxococcus sp. K15C18031901]|uniref:anthrone oxygenase family protein n=1 Tax=Myxococcus dinghuensis TaxID=2906761 RepID=UPI0020A70BBE|nr:anthrone oxygenase family protein [Myxococcus dinghuensis]MCP3103671.1 DUF1772 domain-containing protein [Myxococcus dinghuensis]
MLEATVNTLTWLAAAGSALLAGTFFAFSSFVMKGLSRLPPERGIQAMQALNVAALERGLMSAFFGTTGVCLLLAVSTPWTWSTTGAGPRLAGALLLLVGGFVVTAAFNVPRNELLAALSPTSPEAASQWRSYVATWTAWNHVRTAACLAAALLLARATR